MAYEPERIEIAGQIPTLIWRAREGGRRPAIIYLSGGGQTKHDVAPEDRETAHTAGVTLVSFDMHQHGDRQPPDFKVQERAGLDEFFHFVEHTTHDLDTVIQYLRQDPAVDSDHIGIRAISLSASAALAAIAQGLEVSACLSICGAGDFATAASWRMHRNGLTTEEISGELHRAAERLGRLDPLHHPEMFPPCAVMMIHGVADESVPIGGHRALFDALVPYYLDRPQDCVFLAHPGRHGIRPGLHRLGWTWLLEHLAS